MAAIALRSHRAASRLLKNCPALAGSLGSFSGSSHDVAAAPVLESPKEVLNRSNAAAAGFAVIPFSMRGFAAVASEEDSVHHVEEERGIAAQGEETSQEEALALFSSADSLVNVTGEDALKYITFR